MVQEMELINNMVERNRGKQIRENELWQVDVRMGKEKVDEYTALIGEALPDGRVKVLMNGQHIYELPTELVRRGRVNALVFVKKL